jgi:LuxR family maltose regulon positive regulatory protein
VESLLGTSASLIVFSAPAGSGKTLTVRQWLDSDERPATWLQLDDVDNDPITLLQYLALALAKVASVHASVFGWLDLPEPPVEKVILPSLMGSTATAEPFLLVLDDTHVVHDTRSWALLWGLYQSLPVGAAIVLIGRSEPPVPLARVRADGELALYGLPELAFDEDEARRLLGTHGAPDGELSVESLMSTTEGWPAGVYLAVLASRSGKDATAALPQMDGRRAIADYLLGEVLAGQPPDVVDFLLRTSVVWRLCPGLCAVLTGRADCADVLDRLERENLFLMRLEDREGWFRYHHLFSELLQQELARRSPGLAAELHRRAAEWCADRDYVGDALHHWLSAGDVRQAGELVVDRWTSRFRTGRILAARQWVDAFTADQLRSQPPLSATAAFILALTGRPGVAGGLLALLPAESLDTPMPEGTSLRSVTMILRALLAADGPERMRDDARSAVRCEEQCGPSPWHSLACHLLGVAEWACGDDAAAADALRVAAYESGALHSGIELAALGHLSLIAGDHQRWAEAEGYAAEAARSAEAYSLRGFLPSMPARLARDRLCAREGDDDAVEDLEDVFATATPDLCPWIGVQAALTLAEAATDRGDVATTRRWIDEGRAVLSGWAEAPGLSKRLDALEGRLAASAAAGRLTRAEVRVLELLSTNLTAREIAGRLSLSPNTVRTHVKSVYRKLGVSRRSAAVERAIAVGLLAAPPAD